MNITSNIIFLFRLIYIIFLKKLLFLNVSIKIMPKIEEQSDFRNCVFKSLFNQITLFLTKFTQLTILWLEFSDFDQLEIGKMKYKYLVINLSLYVLPNKAHPLYVFFLK